MILPYERRARSAGPVAEAAPRAAEARLAEAVGLAASIGVTIVHQVIVPLRERAAEHLLGRARWRR